MNTDDYMRKLLDLDPLSEAEKITGHDYKEDRNTMLIGLGIGQAHQAAKAEVLAARDDTTFSMSWFDTMRIFSDLGFRIVHQHSFAGGREEKFVVLWHSDGILAKAESYGAERNAADIYFNLRVNEDVNPWCIRGSGGLHDGVWVGHMDVREAMRFTLTELRSIGQFVTPWIVRPFLWLLDYSQPKVPGYDYKAITEQVIATLPEDVRTSITPAVS